MTTHDLTGTLKLLPEAPGVCCLPRLRDARHASIISVRERANDEEVESCA